MGRKGTEGVLGLLMSKGRGVSVKVAERAQVPRVMTIEAMGANATGGGPRRAGGGAGERNDVIVRGDDDHAKEDEPEEGSNCEESPFGEADQKHTEDEAEKVGPRRVPQRAGVGLGIDISKPHAGGWGFFAAKVVAS